MTYILDACAMLAFFNREFWKGYETVKGLLESTIKNEISLCMSSINLVEVHYRIIQLKGHKFSDRAMELIKNLPNRFIRDISDEVYFKTARYKARYSMFLADAFLCATAKSLSAVIVTKDKEIKPAEKDGHLSVLWI
jgi:PIN domain nuclease of toxin-antitoxin system